MSGRNLEIIDWGLLAYGDALERQRALVEDRATGRAPDRLVFVEHPPVVTIGRSGGSDDLRLDLDPLRRKGVEVHRVSRGGRATFHGPGQLVAYPVIRLEDRDLHGYVRLLLETAAATLRSYGLEPSFRKGRPGLWVNGAKIASVGIAVQRWVTYHGLALNVNTDLTGFQWIVPCGNPSESVTSMQRLLGRPLDLAGVRERFARYFRQAFGYEDTKSAHPVWLVHADPGVEAIERMERNLARFRLETVCQSAHCPNIGDCFRRGAATFMILGRHCTRKCRFCAVHQGAPAPVDPEEPIRVAYAAEQMGLRHVVVTSVTRDDLPDGGAEQFVRVIGELRRKRPGAAIEVLTPDFRGSVQALERIKAAAPDVFNHNLETVARLYPLVRPQAQYGRSLGVIEYMARSGLTVKSGLMLGLGECREEIRDTLADLKHAGCRYLTLGQYLAPSETHFPVIRYAPPHEFEDLAETARSMGFQRVAAGPLVRSSYRAEELVGSDPRSGQGDLYGSQEIRR